MRFAVTCLLACLTATCCWPQWAGYTVFNVNNGLPGNSVYRCVEDNKGFLWIATDAGLARFDGKYFRVFTTKDGLPDNEVLSVIKETNGQIWVNCFKQLPAYFDEAKNRFINAGGDTELAKVAEGTFLMNAYPLQQGGVVFANEKSTYLFTNRKLAAIYKNKPNFLVGQTANGPTVAWGLHKGGPQQAAMPYLYLLQGRHCVDSLPLGENLRQRQREQILPAVDDGRLYLFYAGRNRCYACSITGAKPLRFNIDSACIPEAFTYFGFSPTLLSFYGQSGKIYAFNKQTLQPAFTLAGNYGPNTLYSDSKGNVWVGTADKGLALYKSQTIRAVQMPPGFGNTNFLSIARQNNGQLLAGNYHGQVLQAKGGHMAVISVVGQKLGVFRQRTILFSQNKVFTFSEGGVFVNYSHRLSSWVNSLLYAKTAINYSDSIIVAGTTTGLYKLNTITQKSAPLQLPTTRITALAKVTGGQFYYGSTDGLHKFSYDQNKALPFASSNPLLHERVTDLCMMPDGVLWLATANNGVVALHNDTVLAHITTANGLISNMARCLCTAGNGSLWVGTAAGISIVKYNPGTSAVGYNIQNISANDGLANNVVNAMAYANDTVFAATADGISIIPANVPTQKFNIPVQLTGVSINQRDTGILQSYSLNYNQQNIQLQLAGVELTGHFKNFQYNIDGDSNWTDLYDNTLNLELNSGKHTVRVRAVDVNGNTGTKILSIGFKVATPFWKAVWFWLAVAAVIQLCVVIAVNNIQKKKRVAWLAQKAAAVETAALEQQAFTSLMNPHFLFNSLNSIQHYINLQDRVNANRYLTSFALLIRKNFEAAQKTFICLEEEIESIKIYLSLEEARFGSKFGYNINIDENIDPDDWMVPTMMLQPFLENALLHGIMQSQIPGEINVLFAMEDGSLAIIITDNGIGIANSTAMAAPNHKSLGMALIQKRIAALAFFGAEQLTLTISPAFNSSANPGCKIKLVVPAGLYHAWLQARQQPGL